MRAWIYRKFGSPEVLELAEAAEPAAPAKGVVVALKASALNVLDTRSRAGKMFPFVDRKFPKTPGIDVAGVVTAVGPGVSRLKVGDAVFGAGNAFKGGALAERVVVPEDGLAVLPQGLDYETAATLPTTGLAALQAVRDLGRIAAGQRLLVHGGSGAAGLIAIQLGKLAGAEVTSVSGANGLDAARAAGADVALDYRRKPVGLKGPYDVIVNFSGALPYAAAKPLLTRTGRFIEASPTIPKFMGSMLANPLRAQKHLMLQTIATTAALTELGGLVAAGKVTRGHRPHSMPSPRSGRPSPSSKRAERSARSWRSAGGVNRYSSRYRQPSIAML